MSTDPSLIAWMVEADRHAGFRVDLYTFTTKTNEVYRWTSHDCRVLTTDGRLFVVGPGIERSRIRLSAGIEVSTMDLTLHVDDEVVLGGIPALHYAERGLLDGADVQLEWAYFDENGVLKGLQRRFSGTTGLASFEMGRIELQARSELAKLNTMVPREVYQPSCLNQLFDSNCGLDRDAYTITGTVTSVPSGRAGVMEFTDSGLSQSAGWFDLGAIEFHSGGLNRIARTVKQHAAGGVLRVSMAWPEAPAVGDTFVVIPGCNRSVDSCRDKFNNLRFGRLAFRGTPYVPAPETVA